MIASTKYVQTWMLQQGPDPALAVTRDPSGGGGSLVVNEDETVSPARAKHLVLGLGKPRSM